ncbi:DciA family protein [Candidatus Vallotia cooleyia]|uniref:DciA family protein n=1 Tax=Candidatus Vallotiella adelgis TaxID=1177211 RepID=UPI001D018FA8|nr:DciA family protein [Candidatus Vallotia cooleyia]UDG82216.1 hypothetical protein GJV44_00465 [Candidatus Vallotia cooleyia]
MSRYSSYPSYKPFKLQPLAEFISSSIELTALKDSIRQVAVLKTVLQTILPSYLGRHVNVCPIQRQVLTIFAAHNALAVRLHHWEPTMLTELQQQNFVLRAIKIRVYPQGRTTTAAQIKQARVSAAGADSLRKLADELHSSPLQKAVARMAQQHMQYSNC